MTQAEWYAMKAREDAERRAAVQEASMREKQASMAKSPGSYSPWEKKAVDEYMQRREDARRFDATDVTRNREIDARTKVAEYDWMGKRDAGSAAAQINAEATKYGADKAFEGIKTKAESDAEIARNKAEAEKWIAGRNAEATEAGSKREWGYTDENGTFHPGGRVAQAQAQGEAAAKIAEQNNQARIEQEKIKAQAKVAAQAMAKDTRIASAIGGNPMLANNPEKAQEMLEALAGAGLSAEEAAEIIERRNKAQGGQGTEKPPAQGNDRSQKIRSAYQQRGMGV